MDYKDILGLASIGIAFVSYGFYFHDIFNHHTKPHAFSWFIWGILMSISFFAQNSDNAGAGSWVTGMTAIICFIISFIAFQKGMRNVKTSDWISLCGAMLALIIWLIVKQPVFSVLLVTIIYSLGFFPTFRKSFSRPQDETLVTFILNGLKFFISLFALNHFSLLTAFYPSSLVLINWGFALMLIIRRKQLK